MNVQWFSCIHEVGFDEVEWYQPPERRILQTVPNQPPEVIEYQGRWTIPQPPQKSITTDSETDQWDSGGTDVDSFVISLAKEVANISHSTLGRLRLVSKISRGYLSFLEEENAEDSLESRSVYRVIWWVKARDGNILDPE
jgi:hypothetical protein